MSNIYNPTPRERNLNDIGLIALRHGCTRHDILGPSKSQSILTARRACIAMFRKRGHSIVEIGRIMNRDHSTISHALAKMSMRKPVVTIGVAGASAGLI